jgi:BMFP domain-containing protein YqiC
MRARPWLARVRLFFTHVRPTSGSGQHKTPCRARGAHQFRQPRTALVRDRLGQTPHKEQMDMNNFFNDLQGKINEALENSPAKDIERNVKAMMTQGFSKLDLVTREEFDIQAQVLAKTRAKLEELEARVAVLEARLAAQSA